MGVWLLVLSIILLRLLSRGGCLDLKPWIASVVSGNCTGKHIIKCSMSKCFWCSSKMALQPKQNHLWEVMQTEAKSPLRSVHCVNSKEQAIHAFTLASCSVIKKVLSDETVAAFMWYMDHLLYTCSFKMINYILLRVLVHCPATCRGNHWQRLLYIQLLIQARMGPWFWWMVAIVICRN